MGAALSAAVVSLDCEPFDMLDILNVGTARDRPSHLAKLDRILTYTICISQMPSVSLCDATMRKIGAALTYADHCGCNGRSGKALNMLFLVNRRLLNPKRSSNLLLSTYASIVCLSSPFPSSFKSVSPNRVSVREKYYD